MHHTIQIVDFTEPIRLENNTIDNRDGKLWISLDGLLSNARGIDICYKIFKIIFGIKGLSHLADLARRSYTGAKILRFSGIGASTAAQRYHIAKNGSTSSGHRQNIGEKFCNGRRRYKFLNRLKNV